MSRPSTVYAVGTIHETASNGDLVIMKYIDNNHRVVQFLDTGYTTTVGLENIRRGNVKDRLLPSVYGVGYLGHDPELENHPLRTILYQRWKHMLERVYLRKTGKAVDPSWHCFSTFMRDALTLKGIELLTTHRKENPIDLDSDIIPLSQGVQPKYSRETCQWVTRADNVRVRNIPKQYVKRPLGTVIETKHGPVTIIEKDGAKWHIQFPDGQTRWLRQTTVLRNQFSKPSAD